MASVTYYPEVSNVNRMVREILQPLLTSKAKLSHHLDWNGLTCATCCGKPAGAKNRHSVSRLANVEHTEPVKLKERNLCFA